MSCSHQFVQQGSENLRVTTQCQFLVALGSFPKERDFVEKGLISQSALSEIQAMHDQNEATILKAKTVKTFFSAAMKLRCLIFQIQYTL